MGEADQLLGQPLRKLFALLFRFGAQVSQLNPGSANVASCFQWSATFISSDATTDRVSALANFLHCTTATAPPPSRP